MCDDTKKVLAEVYRCRRFVFVYKDETYESQEAPYYGDLIKDVKHSFSQGANILNEKVSKKRTRRASDQRGFVSTIRRKLSTDVYLPKNQEQKQHQQQQQKEEEDINPTAVEDLQLNIEQKGDEITITVLSVIDPRWFRKATKIFFQWQLVNNGII